MTSQRSNRGELDRERGKSDFDPVAEGKRYHLAPEVSAEIWRRVRAESLDGHGLPDDHRARQRFHQVAARAAVRGGGLRPGPGKTTLVEARAQGAHPELDPFAVLAPGRLTRAAVDDRSARDADATAGDAMRGEAAPAPLSARRKPVGQAIPPAGGPPGAAAPSMLRALAGRGGGAPLDERTRTMLEEALDADLSAVRIHTDRDARAAAAAIDARAFTVGSDIYLGEGQGGDELVAHEVAHTLQPAGGTAALSDPDAPAEREAARFALGFIPGIHARIAEPRAAVIQRDSAGGGRVAQLRTLLDDDDEDGAISLMGQLTTAEVAQVLASASLRELAVSAFDDEEMYRGVRAMNGNLVQSLAWLFAEDTEVGYALDIIGRCSSDAQKSAVYASGSLRASFVSLCGDDEMRQVVDALGGTLKQKLGWMFAEGTSWEVVRALVAAAPEAQKAEIRGDRAMRANFVSLLGNDEMRDLVVLLGGTLVDQLDWMFAEGSDWPSLRMVIERQPDAAQRAAVRASTAMRDGFVEIVGNDEMEELVVLLGGDLHWQLGWMFAEGTDFDAVKRRIYAAPAAERATVRADSGMRDQFVSLLGDDEMAELVNLLGGDLVFKVDWLIAEGTSWDTIKGLINNAPEAEKAATRASTTARDRFVDLLDNDEMREAVQLLGGDLRFKLDWMLTEGTSWGVVKPMIQAASEADRAAVRADPRMKGLFIDLLGDDEMKEAVALLGGDLRFKLDWMLAEGTDWASVKALIQAASEPDKAGVRGDPRMKGLFVDLLGNDEMKEAVALLGGDLRFKLDWMFAEGTDWASVKALIQAAPEADKAAVRASAAMKDAFIDLLGNDEMKEAVALLGGDLRFKLDWMFAEGTDWASVKTLIQAAPETEKAAVRGNAAMKGRFIDLLGDDEMKEAVALLGGDLYFKLSWTLAEGTDWASVKALIQAAEEAGKARVRGDLGMRGWFVDNLDNAEMAEAVQILGGDLAFKLSWTLAEGTDWESVKALVQAAPATERRAVLADQEIFDQLVALVGNDQMRELLDLLGAELLTRVRWMLAEGTDNEALRAAIAAATPEQQMALIQDTMLGEVLGVLSGSAIAAFPALADAGRFATAMSVPLMVTELLEKPAQDVLDRLAADPAAARAALEHMNDGLSWMSPLPKRSGLSAPQRQQLRVLFDNTARVPQRWALFERRFGADLSGRWGSTLDPGDLGHLWVLLERLPDAQIEDNSHIDDLVRNFKGGGTYGGSEINIGEDTGGSHTFYDNMDWKPAADMAAFLGIPESDLAARVTSGQLQQRTSGGVTQYRIASIGMPYFDHTVLHEVGHAVDDMLGNHTNIVYSWAGWEKFSEGSVRQWADLMGGWGTVQPGDNLEDVKHAICSVMDDYMDESSDIPAPASNIGAQLDANHPFKKYASWPIVQRAGTKMFHYTGAHPYNDGSYLYTANFYYQKWMRVKSLAVQNIPRDYTRFAPEEWFADMYAEYYRQYDGTPATEHLKGGNCPATVKTWFDSNVDNLGHTPQASASGGSPAPHSGVSGGQK